MTEGMDDAMFAKSFYCSKNSLQSLRRMLKAERRTRRRRRIFLPRVRRETDKRARFKKLGVSPGNDDKCVSLSE